MVKIALYSAKNYDRKSFTSLIEEGRFKNVPEITYIPDSMSPESVGLAQGCEAICVFVNDKCDADIIAKLKSMGVKAIFCRCAGFDNVDLEAAAKSEISVMRVPEYSPFAVAEFAWTLLMCLNRKVHQGYNRNRDGNFTIDGLEGMDLHGKVAGVLGTGKIGQKFINIALGFGMTVMCYDVYESEDVKKLPNVKYYPLDEVLRNADIVTLHAPLLPSTYHMINKERLALVKPHVLFVNTSRGGLVDTPAMLEAIHNHKVGGYATDVYEKESGYFFNDHNSEVIGDPVLAAMMNTRNVILTAHQAFLTREALNKIAETTLENYTQFFVENKRSKELKNVVESP